MRICRSKALLSAVFVLLMCCMLNSLVYAQESLEQTRKTFFWVNGGIGLASSGGAIGLNLSVQPSRPGFLLLSLRGIGTAEILGDDLGEIAVLVGYSSKRPRSYRYFSIATGIGRVDGSAIDETVGIPLEVQLFFTPLSFAGIGLQGFANFNKEQTFGGVLICLQFGKVL